jgi:hypothetical protein
MDQIDATSACRTGAVKRAPVSCVGLDQTLCLMDSIAAEANVTLVTLRDTRRTRSSQNLGLLRLASLFLRGLTVTMWCMRFERAESHVDHPDPPK